MTKISLFMTLCVLILSSNVSFAAGDASAGKSKAAICSTCHGAQGISQVDLWPNLAGQKAGYLEKQIKAFRDGLRKDPSMTPVVKDLMDQDAKDLAAYFSGLK